jgi:glycosyl transferase family 25
MNALGNGEVKIYVISLPEAEKRRSFMRFQLDAPGMPEWRFVDAVRGASLAESEILELYENGAEPRLTRSEIGCAISHINALKLVLSNEDEFAIILEDDALLSTRFLDIVDSLKKISYENQDFVVILHWAQMYFRFGRIRLGRDHYLHKIYSAHGAQGYLVTRRSARLLLDLYAPITKNPDDWPYFKKKGRLDIRCLVPYCVGHGLIGRASQIVHPNQKKPPITRSLGKLRKRLVHNFGFQMVVQPVFAIKRQKMNF